MIGDGGFLLRNHHYSLQLLSFISPVLCVWFFYLPLSGTSPARAGSFSFPAKLSASSCLATFRLVGCQEHARRWFAQPERRPYLGVRQSLEMYRKACVGQPALPFRPNLPWALDNRCLRIKSRFACRISSLTLHKPLLLRR